MCIYLPWEEYRFSYNINYDESGNRLHKLLRKSKFSRICVTSRLHGDFRWLKGDPALPKKKCRKKNKGNDAVEKRYKKMNLQTLRRYRVLYGF